MASRSVINTLIVTGLTFEVILCLVLLVKRLWTSFPCFTAYTFFNLTATIVGFLVKGNVKAYFFVFWISEAVGVLLGFAVLFELFSKLLSDQPTLHKLAWGIFGCSLAVLVGVGALVLYLQTPVGAARLSAVVLVIAQAVRVIEVGLLICLFSFSTAFGLHWRQQVFGIALGLGIYLAVELINVTMKARMSPFTAQIFSSVRIIAYDLSLLVWIGYILVPEPAVTGELPKREQLEQWNRAVMEFMHQ